MKQAEEFDISGSPAKEPEEEIELSSRGVVPSERRIGTPERAPATKRRPVTDHKSSPPKRLVIDPENNMESEDVRTDGAMGGGEEMQFKEESYAGGDKGQDSMRYVHRIEHRGHIRSVLSAETGNARDEDRFEGWIQHGSSHWLELRVKDRQRQSNETTRGRRTNAGDWLSSMHVFLELAGAQQTQHEAQRGMAGKMQR